MVKLEQSYLLLKDPQFLERPVGQLISESGVALGREGLTWLNAAALSGGHLFSWTSPSGCWHPHPMVMGFQELVPREEDAALGLAPHSLRGVRVMWGCPGLGGRDEIPTSR